MEAISIKEIEFRLLRIFNTRFKIESYKLGKEYYDNNLLGDFFGLNARDLLYVYFDIKKEFNIEIPEVEISKGKFSTLNGIMEIVIDQKMPDKVKQTDNKTTPMNIM